MYEFHRTLSQSLQTGYQMMAWNNKGLLRSVREAICIRALLEKYQCVIDQTTKLMPKRKASAAGSRGEYA